MPGVCWVDYISLYNKPKWKIFGWLSKKYGKSECRCEHNDTRNADNSEALYTKAIEFVEIRLPTHSMSRVSAKTGKDDCVDACQDPSGESLHLYVPYKSLRWKWYIPSQFEGNRFNRCVRPDRMGDGAPRSTRSGCGIPKCVGFK